MWTATFWRQAGERAVKTFCQAAVAMLTGDGLGLLDVDWLGVAQVAALAAVVSVLTSVGSAPFGPADESPSLVSTRPRPPREAVRILSRPGRR